MRISDWSSDVCSSDLSPAGTYLQEHQVAKADFNSYGARRGNHEVMMRGTFANIRIRNEMTPGVEGGITKHIPSGAQMPIYDAAMKYKAEGTPLVRSEEHTSELQSLMRISYAVFCLKKKKK